MKEYNIMVITVNDKEYELDDINITGNSSEEQEITITSVKADGLMHIYTSDNSYLTKAKKCIRVNPEEWKITNIVFRKDGSISGVMITAPKKYLTFRKKKNPGNRSLSLENISKGRENLIHWREAQRNKSTETE